MRSTGFNSAGPSQGSRRSGTGWPRRWWPSKADNPDLTALLAKAAAGKAALTAARHCQQVLGGIGFTAEHDLHHHVKRALVLDGLLGSSKELTRKAGAGLRARGSAPRLADL
jgi:alkylation response protein AidB-like acyl-CoA dehydrogenase